MGAALSLPLLSFFALPAFTSYGTSMNVLFFTLNWYILLLTHPPLQVELIGIALVQVLLYLVPALLFLLFDTGFPSVAVHIKSQGELALPGRRGRKQVAKIAAWSVLNVWIGGALLAALEMSLKYVHRKSALSLSKTMPMPWAMIKSVFLLLFIRGFLQYYIHKHLLHAKSSPFTKLHITWQHSVPSPFSLTATYDHPIAYLVHHWLPLYIPAIALRMHILPFLFALAITCLEELLTYSGYSVMPSGILLPGMARRTDNHFICKGQGNFASYGVLDWVSGTSVGGDVVDDMKAEWSKHDGKERLTEAGRSSINIIDGIGEKVKGKGGGRLKIGKK